MGYWRTQTESWLSSEQRDLDEHAEAAFAEIFAALPPVSPSADFAQRATRAAWIARARRRRTAAVASVAAALLVVVLSYALFGLAGGWLLATASFVAVSSAVSLVAAVTTTVQWWFATALAGNTVAGIIASPQSAAALLAAGLVSIAAFYTLHRLLRAELRFGGSQSICV